MFMVSLLVKEGGKMIKNDSKGDDDHEDDADVDGDLGRFEDFLLKARGRRPLHLHQGGGWPANSDIVDTNINTHDYANPNVNTNVHARQPRPE